jgi:hypothetical protein
VCDAVVWLPCENRIRPVKAVVKTKERLAVSVKAGDRMVDRIKCIVIAPFTILSLMIDDPVLYLNLSC